MGTANTLEVLYNENFQFQLPCELYHNFRACCTTTFVICQRAAVVDADN